LEVRIMENRRIICISREYGSSGRIVGEKLAEKLGITCYDKKLLEKIAKENGLAEEYVNESDEKPVNWLAMGFPMGIRNPYNTRSTILISICRPAPSATSPPRAPALSSDAPRTSY
jgi:hypothetical protein